MCICSWWSRRFSRWRGNGQVPFLLAEQRKGWNLMIFCARATRGRGRRGRVAWPSSCSRNAHDKNVLVRRAQSRIDQATLLKNEELGRRAQWKINQPPSLG